MIARTVLSSLIDHVSEPEITLITGPRQSGKTTLMRIMMEQLEKQNEKYIYLNLDIEADFRKIEDQEKFIQLLQLELGTKGRSYVFIDEIQRKTDGGLFLKGLYDSNIPYKFIVSGSGSVELKEKVSEGLAGRKRTFNVNPLSLQEFINFRTKYKYENNLREYLKLNGMNQTLLDEYLHYGGYPRVVLEEKADKKQDALASIYESFIDKDIKELLDVQNTFAIADILALLSVRIGQLSHTGDITEKVALHHETVKKYLYYLEKTYILKSARPFYTNREQELVKSTMFYFLDTGMRNYVYNRLQHYDSIISGSMLFQNCVYSLLGNRFPQSDILYWRTKDGAEVDFVVRTGVQLLPVEVKFSDLETDTLPRSLYSFIEKYNPKEAWIVNKSYRAERKLGSTTVQILPYWEIL